MSRKVKFKLNRAGVRELMKSDAMMGICKDYANSAKQRLGDGYEVDSHVGTNRVNAMIYATWYQTKKENSDNNVILKALR